MVTLSLIRFPIAGFRRYHLPWALVGRFSVWRHASVLLQGQRLVRLLAAWLLSLLFLQPALLPLAELLVLPLLPLALLGFFLLPPLSLLFLLVRQPWGRALL